MADILNELINNLKTVLGLNLKSIVLYGSRASGDAIEKHSDYNLILILDKTTTGDLKPLKKIMHKWVKRGNHIPMIFTPKTLINSADVFPMEFYDIKETGKLLFGENYFSNLTMEDTQLRHECEFELRNKLIRLKQNYILTKNASDIKKLLINSITTFLIIFRHITRLTGEKPPEEKTGPLNILAKKIGFDASIFSIIYEMKKGNKTALQNDPEALMGRYLDELEKVSEFVNNL